MPDAHLAIFYEMAVNLALVTTLERVYCVIIATPPPIPGTPQEDSRLVVKDALRRIGFNGKVAVRSHDQVDGPRDVDIGGDIILSPFSDAATRAAELLQLDGGARTVAKPAKDDDCHRSMGRPCQRG